MNNNLKEIANQLVKNKHNHLILVGNNYDILDKLKITYSSKQFNKKANISYILNCENIPKELPKGLRYMYNK